MLHEYKGKKQKKTQSKSHNLCKERRRRLTSAEMPTARCLPVCSVSAVWVETGNPPPPLVWGPLVWVRDNCLDKAGLESDHEMVLISARPRGTLSEKNSVSRGPLRAAYIPTFQSPHPRGHQHHLWSHPCQCWERPSSPLYQAISKITELDQGVKWPH